MHEKVICAARTTHGEPHVIFACPEIILTHVGPVSLLRARGAFSDITHTVQEMYLNLNVVNFTVVLKVV